jgi:hypothetical protein
MNQDSIIFAATDRASLLAGILVLPPADNVVTVMAESLEAHRRRLRLLGSASSVATASRL